MAQCPSCIRLWESSKPVGIFLLSGMRNMSIRHKYDLAREEGYLLWGKLGTCLIRTSTVSPANKGF
jgi:hypothetical protein